MFNFLVYLYLLINVIVCHPVNNNLTLQDLISDPAVKRLQEYIRIDSSRTENVELIADFWRRQAEETGLPFAVYRPAGMPICILTLRGRRPDLPSIMLNHHGDVVPGIYTSMWKYPPFSAHIDEHGDMYGRGTQDTKGLGIQYLEAVRKLIQNNETLDRTLHLTVMPDEETGGSKGMESFMLTEDFKCLNIGFALDEGVTSTDDTMFATYQDKRPFQVRFNIVGEGGHGSKLTNGSVIEKLQYLLNNVLEFRSEQSKIKDNTTKYDYGAYTTININIIQGGVATNLIPREISVVIDIRLATSANVSDIQAMLDSWLSKLGNESTMEVIRRSEVSPPTAVDDSNPYWIAMRDTLNNLGFTVQPIVLYATSDMLILRERLGIAAIGFSSRTNTAIRIHDANEYIPVENFLRGIDIYYEMIKNLANVPDSHR